MDMDPRPTGIAIALIGAVGTAIAALADPLGIGEGEVFGWLQITGTVIGAIVTLLGIAIASEWVPVRRQTTAAGGTQTTVVQDSTRE